MSYESHQEAMNAWKVLEGMEPATRLGVLNEPQGGEPLHISHHAPCSGALAGMVFRRLGIDKEEWSIYYIKLYGRPVARVWKLYEAGMEAKPEQLNGLINSFGKRVPALAEYERLSE